MSLVSLGGAQAYYGEGLSQMRSLVDAGVDYLVCDALAEFNLATMQAEREQDEALGFDRGLAARVAAVADRIAAGETKLITDGGGINLLAARRAVVEACREAGAIGIRVAVVMGDDVMSRSAQLGLADDVRFANVYLGAAGIVRALEAGADIVITGRVADASLFLAPLMHEFGWGPTDWDRLAAGIVAGHLLECSCQVTGGNYSGDWWNTVNLARMGYPIAEVDAAGTVVVTKPPGSAGRVSFDTVREQLLYEVHDPSRYMNPDVVVDMTSVTVREVGPDRVELSAIRGAPAPATLKGVTGRPAGWCGEMRFAYTWPDAHAKARHMTDYMRRRAGELGIEVREWCEEFFGVAGFGGPTVEPAPEAFEPPEVVGRIAWRTDGRDEARRLLGELGALGCGGPPHVVWIGHRAMQSAVWELLAIESFFVDRELVEPGVAVDVELV